MLAITSILGLTVTARVIRTTNDEGLTAETAKTAETTLQHQGHQGHRGAKDWRATRPALRAVMARRAPQHKRLRRRVCGCGAILAITERPAGPAAGRARISAVFAVSAV